MRNVENEFLLNSKQYSRKIAPIKASFKTKENDEKF